MLLGSKLRGGGWYRNEGSTLISPLQAGWKHITSTAMEGAIPPHALERSSTPKEWEELVGWVLGELVRLPTG